MYVVAILIECDYICCIISLSLSSAHVEFTEQPGEVASSTREPLLSCSATSIPVAQISWFQVLRNGTARQITSRDVGISIGEELEDDNCTVRSTLQLPPITDLSVTGYYCQGNNGFFLNNSNTFDLLQSMKTKRVNLQNMLFFYFALYPPPLSHTHTHSTLSRSFNCLLVHNSSTLPGVPAAPEVIVRVLSEKSVEVEWTTPTSLLPLDHYTVTLYQDPTDREHLQSPLQSTTRPSSEETRLVFEDLRPFTVYSVEVEVGNIAGNNISSGPMRLQTLEAGEDPTTNQYNYTAIHSNSNTDSTN